MWLVIRVALSVLAIYVVITASDEQKSRMMMGVQAFAGAAGDACTRNSLCNEVVVRTRSVVEATTQRIRHTSVDRGPALLER